MCPGGPGPPPRALGHGAAVAQREPWAGPVPQYPFLPHTPFGSSGPPTRRRAVKQGRPGASVGTTDPRERKGEWGGGGVTIGQGEGGHKMGTAACGGRGFKGRAVTKWWPARWLRQLQANTHQRRHTPPPPPALRQPTPGVVKQDKSSGGSVDTTKTRSGPQRVRMSSGERPIGAAKSDTEALCQPPPPPGGPLSLFLASLPLLLPQCTDPSSSVPLPSGPASDVASALCAAWCCPVPSGS